MLIDFIEVTQDKFISTILVRTSDDEFQSWGKRRVTDDTYRFEFTSDRQPVGLEGYYDFFGITSFNMIYYSWECAEEVLNITIDPLGQAYNDNLQNQRDFVKPAPAAELTWWEQF